MQPAICRWVIAPTEPDVNCGADRAPALITRVWGQHPDGGWIVNLRVFADGQLVNERRTSVRLFDTEDLARAAGGTHIAWWGPRV